MKLDLQNCGSTAVNLPFEGRQQREHNYNLKPFVVLSSQLNSFPDGLGDVVFHAYKELCLDVDVVLGVRDEGYEGVVD